MNCLPNSIRVLIPLDDIKRAENPYVVSLVENIENMGNNVTFLEGTDVFWKRDDYDIVHFMWPTAVLDSSHTCRDLEKRLAELKMMGIKIVSTCHNLVPHYDSVAEHIRCYEIVYEECDEIYHLGNYSLELFRRAYSCRNRLLYHPVYTKRYILHPSRKDALKKLRLGSGKKYVLCFGQVRDDEERRLIRHCAGRLKKDGFVFLVPSFLPYRLCFAGNILKLAVKKSLLLLIALKEKLLNPNIRWLLQNKVQEAELPYYFSVADVAFIHRVKILNSGNLPLNFYFGNVVVGPDIGNVGAILKERENFVFSPADFESAADAIKKGYEAQLKGLGKKNREYAIKNWGEEIIAMKQRNFYMELYLEILRGRLSKNSDA